MTRTIGWNTLAASLCSLLLAVSPTFAQRQADHEVRDMRSQRHPWTDVTNSEYGVSTSNTAAENDTAFALAVAAVPVGGTLYIPGNDLTEPYLVSSKIAITRGEITVLGGGQGAYIEIDGGTAVYIFKVCASAACTGLGGRISNVQIENVILHDNDPTTHSSTEETHGIIFRNVDHGRITNVKVSDMGDECIDLIESTDVIISNSTFTGCSRESEDANGAIGIQQSDQVTVTDNYFINNHNWAGIHFGLACDDVILSKNTFLNMLDSGTDNGGAPTSTNGARSGRCISASGSTGAITNLQINNNLCVSPDKEGIGISLSGTASNDGFNISNNTISGGGTGLDETIVGTTHYGAITVQHLADNGVINGNTIRSWGEDTDNATQHGIFVSSGGTIISNNRIHDAGDGGIFEDSADNTNQNSILGNHISWTANPSGAGNGIGIRSIGRTSVIGNTILRPDIGIFTSNAAGMLVTENYIEDADVFGMQIDDDALVINNSILTVNGASGDCITISGTGGLIEGNTINTCGAHGVDVNSTSTRIRENYFFGTIAGSNVDVAEATTEDLLASCNTIDTDAYGTPSCGTDAGGFTDIDTDYPNQTVTTTWDWSGGSLTIPIGAAPTTDGRLLYNTTLETLQVGDDGGATHNFYKNGGMDTGTAPTVPTVTGEQVLDTNGDTTNITGDLIRIRGGSSDLYMFPLPIPLAASEDNYVMKYDAAGKSIQWEAEAGGGGGMTNFDIDGDNNSPQTVADGEEALFVGGVGITTTAGATRQVSFALTPAEVGAVTWLDNADRAWTFDIAGAGTNPVFSFSSNLVDVSVPHQATTYTADASDTGAFTLTSASNGINVSMEINEENATDSSMDLKAEINDVDTLFVQLDGASEQVEFSKPLNIGAQSIVTTSNTLATAELILLDTMTAKTGSDLSFVTGTAGSTDDCAKWDANGDLITTGAACGGTVADLNDVTNVTLSSPADGASLCFTGTSNASVDCTVGGDLAATEDSGTQTFVIQANSVALTTDTTGNYAAGDGEAGNATSLTTDSLDAITEIAAALKTGSDTTLVTGTAGSTDDCAKWDANGDLITSGAACGGGADTNSIKTYFFDSASLQPIIPDDAFAPLGKDAGTNQDFFYRAFDASTQECVTGKLLVPPDVEATGSDTVTFRTYWTPASSTTATHGVAWDFIEMNMGDNDPHDAAGSTPISSGEQLIPSATATDNVAMGTWTATLTTLGWTTGGDLVFFQLCRDVADAADDMTGDAHLISFSVEIPRE